MEQGNEYPHSLKIVVLREDENRIELNVEMTRIESSDPEKPKIITTADYYYEAIQLMLMNKFQMLADSGPSILVNRVIDALDLFRFLIYKALSIQKPELLESMHHQIYEMSKDIVEELTNLLQILDGNGDVNSNRDIYRMIYSRHHHFYYDFLFEIWGILRSECNCNVIEEIDERFYGTKCVAFAMALNPKIDSKIYFSLSGSSNDYVGYLDIKSKKYSWSSDPLADTYDAVSGTLKLFYPNREIVQCHLTDDVRRYTEGKVLMARSIAFLIDEKRDPGYYSCCERKILAYLVPGGFVNQDCHKTKKGKVKNFLSDYEFLIRFEPCDKCKPAMYGCDNIICQVRPKKFRIRRIGTKFEMK